MAIGNWRRAGQNQIGMTNRNTRPSLSFVSAWLPLLILFTTCLPSLSQLTAQYTISFTANNCAVDSFDSSDPTHSVWHTNWFYMGHNFGTYTNTLRKDNAVVATDGSFLNAGNFAIYGYVDTGPGGTVSLKNGGSVGDFDWIGPDPTHPVNNGIQPGHFRNDMNVTFPDVVLPAGAASGGAVQQPTNYTINIGGQIYTNNNTPYNPNKPSSYTIGGAAYSLFITNVTGNPGTPANPAYYMSSTSLNQSLFISASNVVLYLPNGALLSSGNNLTVNTNANVDIYSGADFNTGNGLVNNLFQYAPALNIYGLPGCAAITFAANQLLSANVYAPEATLSFNGGGATTYDVVGTFKVSSVNVNGRYNFHFDEIYSLLPIPPLITTQPQNQAVPVGSDVSFNAVAAGGAPEIYYWSLNQTNPLTSGTNITTLSLTNVQLSDAGLYSAIITNSTNSTGSVTSSPAILFVYTNPAQLAAQLDTPIADGLGNFQFNIVGVTGFNYVLQASTNLTDWVSLQTSVVPFSYTDTNSANWPQRFYRASFVPTGP